MARWKRKKEKKRKEKKKWEIEVGSERTATNCDSRRGRGARGFRGNGKEQNPKSSEWIFHGRTEENTKKVPQMSQKETNPAIAEKWLI